MEDGKERRLAERGLRRIAVQKLSLVAPQRSDGGSAIRNWSPTASNPVKPVEAVAAVASLDFRKALGLNVAAQTVGNGDSCRIRTDDLRFTKPLLYH